MLILGYSSYIDEQYPERMAEVEHEFLECFKNHYRFTIDDDNKLNMDYAEFKYNFPYMHDLLMYVARNFLGSDADKALSGSDSDIYENKSEFLTAKIYETAIRFYLLGSSNNGVKYHNFCHGMVVAFLSHEFLNDYEKKTSVEVDHHSMIVFSGLLHDAAHPGMGNPIYLISQEHKNKLIDYVKERFSNIVVGADKDTYKDFKQLFDNLELFKSKENFVLEDMHVELTSYAYKILLEPLADSKKKKFHYDTISESIGFTLMSKNHDTLKTHVNYIVHVADLFMNGLSNPELLIEGVKGVYYEFMIEAYEISKLEGEKDKILAYIDKKKVTDKGLPENKWNSLINLVCSSTIGGTYNGQKFFNGFVKIFINHLETDLSINEKQSDILKYYKSNVTINNGFFDLIGGLVDGTEIKDLSKIEKKALENFENIMKTSIRLSYYDNETINDLCTNKTNQIDFSKGQLYGETDSSNQETLNSKKVTALNHRLLII